MKNHIALAIALALGSTFAIAGDDKHKSDSTAAPAASEQSATEPKAGEEMKEGAAGAAGPESSKGVSGAASGDAAVTTPPKDGEAAPSDSDKPKK